MNSSASVFIQHYVWPGKFRLVVQHWFIFVLLVVLFYVVVLVLGRGGEGQSGAT